MKLNTEKIKKDFPLFHAHPDLIYLDSTATALKPDCVIQKEVEYYSNYSANIFRGVYDISEQATKEYEETRVVVKNFIHAFSQEEIIFTRNTTESVNLFVHGISSQLQPGDEILTTITEHHSNFVPWQQLAKKKKVKLRIIDITQEGQLDMSSIETQVNNKTKVLAIAYVSNVLGTVNPVQEIIRKAKKINPKIIIFVDAAQAVPHGEVNVGELDCDAFAFSSHKICGPTGVGILWVKKPVLEILKPYQYGGEMIRTVSVQKTEFADPPHRFEAGTPHIAGVIALKTAINYLQKIGMNEIQKHEVALSQYCVKLLTGECADKVTIIGPKKRQSGIVAFTMKGIHAHDVAHILNEQNIAVRAGHHCAMPLHKRLNIDASVRASFYLYNSRKDVEKLIEGLQKCISVFS